MSVDRDRDARVQIPKGKTRRRRRVFGLSFVAITMTAASCGLPAVPSYPNWGPYGSEQGVTSEVQRRSNELHLVPT